MSDTLTINIAIDFTADKKVSADVHAIHNGKSRNLMQKKSTWAEFSDSRFLEELFKEISDEAARHKEYAAFGS